MSQLVIDPRTKLFAVLVAILMMIFAPSQGYLYGFVGGVALFGVLCGRWRLSLIGLLVYTALRGLIWYGGQALAGYTLGTLLVTGCGFIAMLFPCGMAGAILLSSTPVSQLLAAAVKLRVPSKIYIPLAVMCRYFPSVREDWRYIRGAMKLRGLTLSPAGILRQPAITVECLYVPLMMSASRAADELSAAAMSRGIESPHRRTCLYDLKLQMADTLVMAGFALSLLAIPLLALIGR